MTGGGRGQIVLSECIEQLSLFNLDKSQMSLFERFRYIAKPLQRSTGSHGLLFFLLVYSDIRKKYSPLFRMSPVQRLLPNAQIPSMLGTEPGQPIVVVPAMQV